MAGHNGQHRIALVLQSTSPGGMETHAIDLAAEYARRGNRVLAVVPEDALLDDVARRFGAAGARVERLNTDARAGRRGQPARLARYAHLLRRFRPQVVHVHTGGATGGLAAVALARTVTRATVAITEHDVPAEHPSRQQRFSRGLLDRSAHAVVAVSRRNGRLRAARIPVKSRSFGVVLNGVPLPSTVTAPADVAALRHRLGLAPGDVVVGSLVRLAEGKGLDTLIDAFVLLRAQLPCKLLLVGDGPLRDALSARAADAGVAGDVVFAGHQANPAPFLDAMDAFVLAVPAGSMSIALLEAMGRGLPPVITFGGPEEAVIDGETGLVAPPSDPAALAAAMEKLVRDPALRARLAEAAAAHVREHYSVGRVADDLLDLFATARTGTLAVGLRADAPPDRHPAERLQRLAAASGGAVGAGEPADL